MSIFSFGSNLSSLKSEIYMLSSKLNFLDDIPFVCNFFHSISQLTESNAVRKSTKHAKSFLLFFFKYLWIRVSSTKMLSTHPNPFRKPAWKSEIVRFNSAQEFNLSDIIFVKSLLTTESNVIPRYDVTSVRISFTFL